MTTTTLEPTPKPTPVLTPVLTPVPTPEPSTRGVGMGATPDWYGSPDVPAPQMLTGGVAPVAPVSFGVGPQAGANELRGAGPGALAGRPGAFPRETPARQPVEAYSFQPAGCERTTANSGGTGPRAQARLPQSDN